MGLLGPDGMPISSTKFKPKNTKAPAPIKGNAFGNWAGRDLVYSQLPGGALVQFDLSKLTVDDFRLMRDHYQVNASLAVLSFMQHQTTYRIECSDPKIRAYCQDQLDANWTPLNRALSTAHWAGYSPNVLEWDDNLVTGRVDLGAIKDLPPEECRVEWKWIEGWAPPGSPKPKFKEYDGIRQYSFLDYGRWKTNPGSWPIPADNTLWYSMLMEAGNYYGRKLLRAAFTPWYFSILVHLFANRYYERFGEPTPVGRAPFDEALEVDGTSVRGNTFMLNTLAQLRNRSVVVLPNDTHQVGSSSGAQNSYQYDYDVKYLESQMRGADFERYLTRLDEEISIGLFTPILMLRTADVGSYNLGQQHGQTYGLMVDALNDDRAFSIDNYILDPLVNYNFSPNAPRARIKFVKLSKQNAQLIVQAVTALINQKLAKPDLDELGSILGMTLNEIKETTAPPAVPSGADPSQSETDPTNGPGPTQRAPSQSPTGLAETRKTANAINERVSGQVSNAFAGGSFGSDLRINMGFKRRMMAALEADGVQGGQVLVDRLYDRMDRWAADTVALGAEEFESAVEFSSMFATVLDNEIGRLV